MFPGISLTSFSEPFLITPNAPTTTGTISVFIRHILAIRFPDLYTWKVVSETLVKAFLSEGIATSMRAHFLLLLLLLLFFFLIIIIIIIIIIIVIIIIIIIIIIDRTVTKVERDLLALPVHMGSHGFTDPVVTLSSIKVTNPLLRRIA